MFSYFANHSQLSQTLNKHLKMEEIGKMIGMYAFDLKVQHKRPCEAREGNFQVNHEATSE